MLNVGDSAPNFTLKDTGTEDISLSSLHGKKVILAFFPAAFTPVCEKELCAFRDALSSLNDANATVLGICVDAPFANGAFAKKNELNFPILSDYSRSTVQAYGVALENFANLPGYTVSNRAVFVVDEEGRITYAWVGENLGVEPNYEEVKSHVGA